ncbi:MAG: hypothetical protein ACRBBM_00595 [Pseudomonadaceae bacterium]
MARKPTHTEEQQAATTEAIRQSVGDFTSLEHLSEGQTEAQQLQAAYSEERDLVNQLLGQAQMADAFGKFSNTVFTSKLAYVKENKLYKAIAGKKNENGIQLQGTWDEFCNMLGWTPQHANEAINNLRAFGEEALESMSRMGIGYRELRQFRKLPEDSRSALIEAAKTGNHEAVEFLAEELIAKHQAEKEQLTKERDEAHADYDAQSQVLANRAQELDQVKQELEKAKRRIQLATPDEKARKCHMEAQGTISELQGRFKAELRPTLEALQALAQETGEDQTHFMTRLLRDLELQIAQLRDDFDLPAHLADEEPDWLKDGALEAAEALIQNEQGH